MAAQTHPTYPVSVEGLSTRDAIIDAVYRVILAVDTNNEDLLNASFVDSPETFFQVVGTPAVQGSDKLVTWLKEHVFAIATLHQATNIRVWEINEAAGTAKVSASAVAHHYKNEDAFKGDASKGFVAGGTYDIDAVRDGETWKIKGWTLTLHWITGDRAAVFA